MWKQFAEAIDVMIVQYVDVYIDVQYVTEHFKNLTKNHKTTLDFLKDLKFNSSFPEYQAILGYLGYWSEDNLYVKFCQNPSC